MFGEEHLLHAPVGPKHGYEDVGVRSCILSVTGDHRHLINHLNNSQNMSPTVYTQTAADSSHLESVWTFRMMLMVVASSMFKTLAVRPSPLSLASQHLHRKLYWMPLVGTATDSSSTSQQLSGVAPLWPNWEQNIRTGARLHWMLLIISTWCVRCYCTQTLLFLTLFCIV